MVLKSDLALRFALRFPWFASWLQAHIHVLQVGTVTWGGRWVHRGCLVLLVPGLPSLTGTQVVSSSVRQLVFVVLTSYPWRRTSRSIWAVGQRGQQARRRRWPPRKGPRRSPGAHCQDVASVPLSIPGRLVATRGLGQAGGREPQAVSQPVYSYFSIWTAPSGDRWVPVELTPFSQQGDGSGEGEGLRNSSRVSGGSLESRNHSCCLVKCSFPFTLTALTYRGEKKIFFSTYFKPDLIYKAFS